MKNAWVAIVSVALLAGSMGCSWKTYRYSDCRLHGKVGRTCSIIATPVTVAADVVCLPVTVWTRDEDKVKAPGVAVEAVAYHTGAAVAWPLHLVFEKLPAALKHKPEDEAELTEYYVSKLPELSEEEYKLLVQVSKRRYAASCEWKDKSVWTFGSKRPLIKNGKKVRELWEAWLRAGRPVDAPAEVQFLIGYAERQDDSYDIDFDYLPEYLEVIFRKVNWHFKQENVLPPGAIFPHPIGTNIPAEDRKAIADATAFASPLVRVRVAMALEGVEEGWAQNALVAALDDQAVTCFSSKILARAGAPPVEELIAKLSHCSHRGQVQIIQLLGELNAPQAVPTLLDYTNYHEKLVRHKAIMALAQITERGPEATRLLISYIKKKKYILSAMAEAVESFDYLILLEHLQELLSHPDISIRISTVKALAKVNDPRAIKGLITAAENGSEWVQKYAIRGLADYKEQKVSEERLETLLKFSNSGNADCRLAAVEGLARISEPRVYKAVEAACSDRNRKIQVAAIEGLASLKTPNRMKLLVDALHSAFWEARVAAAKSLGEIGEPAATDALRKALKDRYYNVRKAAQEALQKIEESSSAAGGDR